MTMTMKEHMEMMDRIRQGKNAELSKIKTVLGLFCYYWSLQKYVFRREQRCYSNENR